MIARGLPIYAVLREDESIDYVEVLACGTDPRFTEARLGDFSRTTSGKRRKVVRVKLIVEEILESVEEQPVTE